MNFRDLNHNVIMFSFYDLEWLELENFVNLKIMSQNLKSTLFSCVLLGNKNKSFTFRAVYHNHQRLVPLLYLFQVLIIVQIQPC